MVENQEKIIKLLEKKVILLIKRGAKAYFSQAAKSYAWTPTGTIPVGI